jgi:hypothetical protein
MPKFVAGEVYRLNPKGDMNTSYYMRNGYLWVYSYYQENDDTYYYYFKSIATGETEWWPSDWMEAADEEG